MPNSEIYQGVAGCIAATQTIVTLHTSKEVLSNFKNLSEPECLEILGTINLAKTTLTSVDDGQLSQFIVEGEGPELLCVVNGLLKTLSSLHDALSLYVNPATNWNSKKIKIFREDYILRQKVDQFIELYSDSLTSDSANNDRLAAPFLHISDEEGRNFWSRHFGNKSVVHWDTFATAFEQCQKSEVSLMNDEFFKSIIDFTQDGNISVFEFAVFLKWFGPLDGCCPRMHDTFRSGILCGAVPGVEANMLLEGKPEGYYLIRFSKTQPGAFALTFVDTALQTKHCLLHHSIDPAGFTLKSPPTVYKSLSDFVACYKNKLKYSISQAERKLLSKSTPNPLSPRGYARPSSDNLCIVCMDAVTNTVFLECGHVACCSVCAKPLSICPVCRGQITRVVPIFRP